MLRDANDSVVARVLDVLSWIVSIPLTVFTPTWKLRVEPVPSSRFTPLNVVLLAIRSISEIRSWNS